MSTLPNTAVTEMICAAEVWIPDPPSGGWHLESATYGRSLHLRPKASTAASQPGLPELVRAHATAIIVSDLTDEWAWRGVAGEEGSDDIGAVIGIPSFDRGEVVAVLVLFLNGGSEARGAVEIWSGRPGRYELSLQSSYYSHLEYLPQISHHVNFPIGSGLPGRVWQTGSPIFIDNLAHSTGFLRASGAQSDRLQVGLGIPIINGTELRGVVVFLTGPQVLPTRHCEVWIPSDSGGDTRLRRVVSWPRLDSSLTDAGIGLTFLPGEGLPGRTWADRRPVILDSLRSGIFKRPDAAADDHIDSAIGWPVFLNDRLSSVVVFGCYRD